MNIFSKFFGKAPVKNEPIKEQPQEDSNFFLRFEGQTDFQLQAMLKDGLGERVTVQGKVLNVVPSASEGFVYVGFTYPNSGILAYFDRGRWYNKLIKINRGDKVAIEGEINHLTTTSATLINCTLLSN